MAMGVKQKKYINSLHGCRIFIFFNLFFWSNIYKDIENMRNPMEHNLDIINFDNLIRYISKEELFSDVSILLQTDSQEYECVINN